MWILCLVICTSVASGLNEDLSEEEKVERRSLYLTVAISAFFAGAFTAVEINVQGWFIGRFLWQCLPKEYKQKRINAQLKMNLSGMLEMKNGTLHMGDGGAVPQVANVLNFNPAATAAAAAPQQPGLLNFSKASSVPSMQSQQQQQQQQQMQMQQQQQMQMQNAQPPPPQYNDAQPPPPQPSQSLKAWLGAMNMEEFFPAFENDGYDELELVKDLTEEDLVGLGITKKGQIVKITKAIQKLQEPPPPAYGQ